MKNKKEEEEEGKKVQEEGEREEEEEEEEGPGKIWLGSMHWHHPQGGFPQCSKKTATVLGFISADHCNQARESSFLPISAVHLDWMNPLLWTWKAR
jgi:hypothetical protein